MIKKAIRQITNILVAISCLLVLFQGCKGTSQPNKSSEKASIKRPANLPKSAFLVNLRYDGEMGDSVYIWINYIGVLRDAGKEYSHIHGFANYNDAGQATDTLYYENMEERKGRQIFDFRNFSYKDDGRIIEVRNKKDSMFLFPVLNMNASTCKGHTYLSIPTVRIDTDNQSNTYNRLIYSDYLSISIAKQEKNMYQVHFLEDTKNYTFMYKTHCTNLNQKISFLDRTDGTIYFLEKDCYLELVDSNNLEKIRHFE